MQGTATTLSEPKPEAGGIPLARVGPESSRAHLAPSSGSGSFLGRTRVTWSLITDQQT